MIRHEWVGEAGAAYVPRVEDQEASLSDFAYESTAALLKAEPRLRTVATLVQRAGPLDERLLCEITGLVAVLLGPSRTVPLAHGETAETLRLAALLRGETTRRRYMSALRRLADGQAAW